MDTFYLDDMTVGETAAVQELLTTGELRRRLLDLGLVPGTRVKCVGQSPAGDPKAYLIRGTAIALRREDAHGVLMRREVM